eukprot:SAG31_NODE_169_length_21415_cov_29.765338_18_plen_86_part_00
MPTWYQPGTCVLDNTDTHVAQTDPPPEAEDYFLKMLSIFARDSRSSSAHAHAHARPRGAAGYYDSIYILNILHDLGQRVGAGWRT